MTVKFHCPKCDKKFVDWGAEKLKFRCPDCEDEKLVLMGLESGAIAKKNKSTLKRKRKAAAPAKKKKAKAAVKKADPARGSDGASKSKAVPAKGDGGNGAGKPGKKSAV